MGQKVNPKILRLGTIYNWSSRWFDDKKYKDILLEDYNLRKALMGKLAMAGVSEIEIERSINSLKLTVNVSKPGMVIGRGGSGLEDVKNYLYKFLKVQKNSNRSQQVQILGNNAQIHYYYKSKRKKQFILRRTN